MITVFVFYFADRLAYERLVMPPQPQTFIPPLGIMLLGLIALFVGHRLTWRDDEKAAASKHVDDQLLADIESLSGEDTNDKGGSVVRGIAANARSRKALNDGNLTIGELRQIAACHGGSILELLFGDVSRDKEIARERRDALILDVWAAAAIAAVICASAVSKFSSPIIPIAIILLVLLLSFAFLRSCGSYDRRMFYGSPVDASNLRSVLSAARQVSERCGASVVVIGEVERLASSGQAFTPMQITAIEAHYRWSTTASDMASATDGQPTT